MSYISDLLHPAHAPRFIRRIVEGIKKFDQPFDFIAVRGTSGIALTTTLVCELQIPVWIVRKGEANHSFNQVETPCGIEYKHQPNTLRYIILDDGVCEGETVRAIVEAMRGQSFEPTLVAVLVYNQYEIAHSGDLECYAGKMNKQIEQWYPTGIPLIDLYTNERA